MNVDHFKAVMAAHLIDRRQALYRQAGNPIHTWSAYHTAPTLGVAIPASVLDYFDASAKALTTTTYTSAKAIADALGLGNKGGRRHHRPRGTLPTCRRKTGIFTYTRYPGIL